MRGRVLTAVIVGLLATTLSATSASAVQPEATTTEAAAEAPAPYGECSLIVICGTVWNFLPSNYSIKVARFGVGSSSCPTWNAGTLTCTIYSLPSGKSSKDIGLADADGYTSSGGWYYTGGTKRNANVWTKITNLQSATCVEQQVGAVCTIN